MKYLFIFLVFMGLAELNAQTVSVDFDNCLVSDGGDMSRITQNGSSQCDCGVVNESLFFDSPTSSLVFDSSYTSLFQKDFTMSFYFMVDEREENIVDIFSVSAQCRIDSSLTIKYIPEEASIRVQMAKDFNIFIELEGQINTDKCWHYLVFQRDDQNYNLFIDGEFADNDFVNANIEIDPAGTMKFSGSPCQAFGDAPFTGKIDDFKIFESVLTSEAIFASYINQDDILTVDTTIFTGASVQIQHTPSCAEVIAWFPSQNVQLPSDLEPIISPDETTLYRLNYDYGICAGQDSVTIAIIDEEAVDCDNLLLANAFTPNNDGLNDEIGISNAFIIEDLRDFEIFDRWGEKVFSTTNKTDSWDGTFRGEKVNSNVFLYKINYSCKGDDFIKTGSLSILR